MAWWTDVSEVTCHDIVWSAKSGAIAANHIEVGVERDDSLHKYTSLPLSVRQGLRVKIDEILSSEENTYNIKNISQSFRRLAAAFSLATSRHVQLVTYIQMTSCNHVFFADHRIKNLCYKSWIQWWYQLSTIKHVFWNKYVSISIC